MTELPTTAERPAANVVIYDGQCRFCRGSVVRLSRLDWRKRLAFISLHDPEVANRWPDLTHEMLMEQMYVVGTRGKRHGGAEAFRYLTRILPPLWPLAPLAHLPFAMSIGQWCYRKIAQQRYRWGRIECEDACQIHFHK